MPSHALQADFLVLQQLKAQLDQEISCLTADQDELRVYQGQAAETIKQLEYKIEVQNHDAWKIAEQKRIEDVLIFPDNLSILLNFWQAEFTTLEAEYERIDNELKEAMVRTRYRSW